MLKSIDVLIGLSVVMLVVSMAVTLVTQGILALIAERGRCLQAGLADLLQIIDAKVERIDAEDIAALVLTQPTIRKLKVWSRLTDLIPARYQFGDVIHREEFTKILLSLGSESGEVNKKLNHVLKANGIENPAKTMENVRMFALQLEKAQPELASDVRHSVALLQEASSQFLAKINLGFDQIMDRVSARFTNNTRMVTLFSAAVVAMALQLDTVNIVNRLVMDDKMRAAFVEQAMQISQDEKVKLAIESSSKPEPGKFTAAEADSQLSNETGNENQPAKNSQVEPGGMPDKTGTDKETEQTGISETEKYYLRFLAGQGVINLPVSGKDWCKNWQVVNIPGIVLSILLLSMGAPFWYSTLGKLLQLRSVLAQKDDVQKSTRQTTQPPEASATPVAPGARPSPALGERGDPNAVG